MNCPHLLFCRSTTCMHPWQLVSYFKYICITIHTIRDFFTRQSRCTEHTFLHICLFSYKCTNIDQFLLRLFQWNDDFSKLLAFPLQSIELTFPNTRDLFDFLLYCCDHRRRCLLLQAKASFDYLYKNAATPYSMKQSANKESLPPKRDPEEKLSVHPQPPQTL